MAAGERRGKGPRPVAGEVPRVARWERSGESWKATEWVKGKPTDEVLTIKNTEIAKYLSLPPVKLHCSMLAEDAIKAAVKDYEARRRRRVKRVKTVLQRRLLKHESFCREVY